jgi:hypothetical protein
MVLIVRDADHVMGRHVESVIQDAAVLAWNTSETAATLSSTVVSIGAIAKV